MRRWLLVTFVLAVFGAKLPQVSAQQQVRLEESKTADVSGVVVDASDGRLLRRVTVCFIPNIDTNGYYSSQMERCDETDDKGHFTLRLPPGRYSHTVNREGYFPADPADEGIPSVIALHAGDELTALKLRMRPAGALRGRVVFADGEPFPGAVLQLRGGRRETSSDTGEYRFSNLLPSDYTVALIPPVPANCDQFLAHRRHLYVQRGAPIDALPIHVDSGREASAPDVVMIEAPGRRVTGRVVSNGVPSPPGWWVSMDSWRAPSQDSRGSFDICGVVPGEHTIRADGRIDGRRLVRDLKLEIGDDDLKGVEIEPEPSATIRARVQFADDPVDTSLAQITPLADAFPYGTYPQPHRNPDGSFLIDDIYTGEYRFFLSPLPPGSYLKSGLLNGQDIIDAPVPIRSGESLDSLVFTVSAKAATLTGIVQDETGSNLPDATVIVQPDPPHGNVDIHRCIRTTDQSGAFNCGNLSPGKYRVAAWQRFPDFQAASDRTASEGTPVELSEASSFSVVLTVFKQ